MQLSSPEMGPRELANDVQNLARVLEQLPDEVLSGETLSTSKSSQESDSVSTELSDLGDEVGHNNNADEESIYDSFDELEDGQISTGILLEETVPKQYVKRMSERRRKRSEHFSNWYHQKTQEFQDEDKQKVREVDEEKMSAKAMINSHNQVVSDPREYQLELFEIAKTRNTIAVLDTGSGKTLIACLLIRHTLDQEYTARAAGKHRRVSFFLVDSITLVWQQAAVLDCNVDAKIGRYCGDVCQGIYKKEQWSKILDDEQVIVMTADVLYNCLTHSFITMQDINLLCIDEAHHAKKNHVYARIIKDFYLSEPEEKRPMIFGMTASPVDARVDVVDAASELEELLHSRIATTSDLVLLQGSVSKPHEFCAEYPKLPHPTETNLYKKLHDKYGDVEALKKVFAFAKNATTELGPWCADQVWKFALSEIEAHKLERRTEKILNRKADEAAVGKMDIEVEKIREARDVVAKHEFLPPKVTLADTSYKVHLLQQYLQHIFKHPTNEKCIVFVTRRYTARVLHSFLTATASQSFMNIAILIGSRPGTAGDESFTFRQQMLTVSQFRRGKLNCLLATAVAEEGLDIPDCSSVIRFDLYSTMIQYIQSRGRARHSKSKFVHMVEKGNIAHRKILADVRNAEHTMRDFCQSLPEDRLINKHGVGSFDNEDGMDGLVYVEPSTGAKLTHRQAMQVVARFVGHLPRNTDDVAQATYVVRPAGAMYACELLLPSNSPLKHFSGPTMATKSAAKRAVAFEACMQLRKSGDLDEMLMPKYYMKELPKMANAHLAVDIHKKSTYVSRMKPSFWNVEDDSAPKELWFAIMALSNPESMSRGKTPEGYDDVNLQPICIASRKKLPPMPSFTVYADKGGSSQVTIVPLKEPLVPGADSLELLNKFTIRFFYDIFNKLFEFGYETIRYWIAPLKIGTCDENSSINEILDWETMKYVNSALDLEWDENTPIQEFVGKFMVDRIQRSRRFSIHGWDANLTPDDPIPEHGARAPGIEDIRDYSYNAGKKGGKWRWVKWEIPKSEPVLLADRVLHRLNYLDPPTEREINMQTQAYVCPSPFSVSMIPLSVVYSGMIFPAISTRMDAYLHAWDVCRMLGVDISLGLALEALTKDSDNTSEHGAEQINVRKGMGNNYERLEFLGDCYLKLATSISLFIKYHNDDEFNLHVKRMVLVCNQHLLKQAVALGLPEYIQSQGFSRRFWYPAMKLLQGKGTGKETVGPKSATHRLGDKTIADVCEALIGAALLDKGLDGATATVSAILSHGDHKQRSFADYYRGYEIPAYQSAQPTASQARLALDIEKQFGYQFKSARLLMSAFTHSSNPYNFEKVPCYQRLEFLGDALLDLACVQYIFDKHPDADPQWLTEHKMAMVSNKFLGAVSVQLGFHKHMRRNGKQLDIAIADYVTQITEARENSESADFWTTAPAPPKALPDLIEAFIGALFIDSEFDYSKVEGFFNSYIRPYFVDMSLYDNFAGQHPTTFLTKQMTDHGCDNWGYHSEQFRNDDDSYIVVGILVHDQIFAYGRGPSAKQARVSASLAALQKLQKMSLLEFAKLCTCKDDRENGIRGPTGLNSGYGEDNGFKEREVEDA